MLLQNLSNIQPIDVIIIICHSLVVASLFFTGIFFFLKARRQSEVTKHYLWGIVTFVFCYGIVRFIMFLFELSVDPFVWYISITEVNQILAENPVLNERFNFIWYIQSILGTFGLFIFLFQLETYILEKRTKYLLSICQLIFSILGLIIGAIQITEVTIGKIILYISYVIPAAFVPLIYFHFARITTGSTRNRALGAGIGYLIFYGGIAFSSQGLKEVLESIWGLQGIWFSYIMYGLLITIGLIVFLVSVKYKEK